MADGWTLLAERPGGVVAGLAGGSDAAGAPVVFAATPAGLRRSADGGQTWAAAGELGATPLAEAVALSSAFARDRTVFATARGGLYRSTDGGETWRRVLTGSRLLALAVSPDFANDHLLFAGSEADGILRSDDGGESWTSANPGLLDLTVIALALSPGFARDRLGFAATASGLYRTRNGGKSWRSLELPLAEPASQCLACSPNFADDRLVLAGTEADGLLLSRDAGASWQVVPALAERGITAVAFSTRASSGSAILAATTEGIARSGDAGQTWRLVGRELGPVLSLAVLGGGAAETLLAGLPGGGIARSTDGGVTWTPSNAGLQAHLLVGLALSPSFAEDQTVFVAGLHDGVSLSTDGGATWVDACAGLGTATVFGIALAPDFARDRTLYAATASGLRRSRDAAASWQPVEHAAVPTCAANVVATGPSASGGSWPVLAAFQDGGLLLSEDGGEGWRSIGGGFDGGEVVSLAFSPAYARDRTLFAGTSRQVPDHLSELVLWRSTDGGARWERWLEAAGPDVLPLAIPRHYPASGVVLAGVGGRVLRPVPGAQEVRRGARRPIWRGPTLGDNATSITALAAAPDGTTVFAATNSGVFRSRDGGATFTAWSEGLTSHSIAALALSPAFPQDRLVYALALGGALWRRDAD